MQFCCVLYEKLETIKQTLHRGKILQQAVEKTGISIDIVTQKAGYKRGTYYLHIKKKDLPISTITKYSKAIGHDFSEDIPEMEEFILEDAEPIYNNEPATIQEAVKQRNEWKEKYYALMEKYHKLLEKQ